MYTLKIRKKIMKICQKIASKLEFAKLNTRPQKLFIFYLNTKKWLPSIIDMINYNGTE